MPPESKPKLPSDAALDALCVPGRTFDELMECISVAGRETGPDGYIFIHGSSDCTDDECICGGPVVVGPVPDEEGV